MKFLLLFFFVSSVAWAEENNFTNPAWLALGHYEKTSGGYKSTAEGEGFFLANNGAEDPAAELAATLAGMAENPSKFADENSHPQCRFPARFLWIKKIFPTQARAFPSVNCSRYQTWLSEVKPQGAWVIFASAFINSPSSMYGHTLLRFSRSGKTAGNPLLDYALSYGADIGDGSGGPAFLIKGLLGSFRGSFTTAPYYLKVQEYNHVENRDFWEYELDLNKEQMALLAAHTWELREVAFAYYFLKRNCAYYLLRLIAVARPDLQLAEQFSFWTIPVDTIRLLDRNHLIRSRRIRASRVNTFLHLRAELSGEEADLAEDFAKSVSAFFPDFAMPADRKALVLDTAYELFRYKAHAINVLSAEQEVISAHILQSRSALEASSHCPDFSAIPAPETGHSSARAGIFVGANKQNTVYDLRYRGALHDFLSDPAGYEPGSELTMGDFHARVEKGRVFFNKAEIVKIRSASALDPWVKKVSWNFSLGLDRAKEYSCTAWKCSIAAMDGGAGFALGLNPENFLYFYLNASVDAGSVLQKSWRLGMGPNLGIKLHPVSFWRILISGGARAPLLGAHSAREKFQVEQSFTWKKNREIRVEMEQRKSYREFTLGHYWYY